MSKYLYVIKGVAIGRQDGNNYPLRENYSLIHASDTPITNIETVADATKTADLSAMSDGRRVARFIVSDITLLSINDTPVEEWKTQRHMRAAAFIVSLLSIIATLIFFDLTVFVSETSTEKGLNNPDMFLFLTLGTVYVVSLIMFKRVSGGAK